MKAKRKLLVSALASAFAMSAFAAQPLRYEDATPSAPLSSRAVQRDAQSRVVEIKGMDQGRFISLRLRYLKGKTGTVPAAVSINGSNWILLYGKDPRATYEEIRAAVEKCVPPVDVHDAPKCGSGSPNEPPDPPADPGPGPGDPPGGPGPGEGGPGPGPGDPAPNPDPDPPAPDPTPTPDPTTPPAPNEDLGDLWENVQETIAEDLQMVTWEFGPGEREQCLEACDMAADGLMVVCGYFGIVDPPMGFGCAVTVTGFRWVCRSYCPRY